jgi:hypothetical protein
MWRMQGRPPRIAGSERASSSRQRTLEFRSVQSAQLQRTKSAQADHLPILQTSTGGLTNLK